MSALLLKQNADYLVHDSYTVETEDHEDHTFNGVMFDVQILDKRPVQALVVDSIHVRGGLGQMSVWCVDGGRRGVEEKPAAWTRHFSRHVEASWRDFTSLKLEPPLILLPGKTYGLYVRSADQGDDGVVYCVEIKCYGAFVLNRRVDHHAIDAMPARWRGDAGSSPLERDRMAECTRHTG